MTDVMQRVSSLVSLDTTFPDQVFKRRYGGYAFFDFDWWNQVEFWTLLQQFMQSSGDNEVTVAFTGQPDASQVLNVASSGENYAEAMRQTPDVEYGGPLVWFPPSGAWVVWGEFTTEFLVLGSDWTSFPKSNLSMTADDLLSYESQLTHDRRHFLEFHQKVIDNYCVGQTWVDEAPTRALRFANMLLNGALPFFEACRELASLRHRFDSPVREMLTVFVGIDSETDHLPVGQVRSEWDAAALASKDQELARLEAAYRAVGEVQARELVKYLKKPSSSEGRS